MTQLCRFLPCFYCPFNLLLLCHRSLIPVHLLLQLGINTSATVEWGTSSGIYTGMSSGAQAYTYTEDQMCGNTAAAWFRPPGRGRSALPFFPSFLSHWLLSFRLYLCLSSCLLFLSCISCLTLLLRLFL
jgi:hypothetical protein